MSLNDKTFRSKAENWKWHYGNYRQIKENERQISQDGADSDGLGDGGGDCKKCDFTFTIEKRLNLHFYEKFI